MRVKGLMASVRKSLIHVLLLAVMIYIYGEAWGLVVNHSLPRKYPAFAFALGGSSLCHRESRIEMAAGLNGNTGL